MVRRFHQFFSLLLIVLSFESFGQCKNFVKKSCLPLLHPFTTNGQINNAVFAPGDHAEMPLTFSEGFTYRVIVCGQEILGKINFKILNNENVVVFDNTDHEFVNLWDFKITNTQQVKLIINVPEEKAENGIMHTGCVSIILGFKKN